MSSNLILSGEGKKWPEHPVMILYSFHQIIFHSSDSEVLKLKK